MPFNIASKVFPALLAVGLSIGVQGQARPAGQQDDAGRPGQQGNQGGKNGQARPARPNGSRPQGPPARPNPGGGAQKPGGGQGRPPVQPPRPGAGSGNRPKPNPGPARPNRPPQWGRPPQRRPSYQFRPKDRDYLRRFYLNHLRAINMARRPAFVAGGYFPFGDIGYLSPVPPHIYGYLPPPPPGYNMGYFDGYVVVYDPFTYFIANVIDLVR